TAQSAPRPRRVPRGRSTYTRAGVPSAAVTSRTVARTGAESTRTAVAPPGAGVTSTRRSSAASPCTATRARHAPHGAVHHRLPLPTAGQDREAGRGNQGRQAPAAASPERVLDEHALDPPPASISSESSRAAPTLIASGGLS